MASTRGHTEHASSFDAEAVAAQNDGSAARAEQTTSSRTDERSCQLCNGTGYVTVISFRGTDVYYAGGADACPDCYAAASDGND